MTRAQLAKFATIGSLYTGQTLAVGFISQLLPAIYREQRLPLEQFWVFSVCLAPFALRFLWAPWVDRLGSDRFGRRKSWIGPCTALAATIYLSLLTTSPTVANLWIVASLVLVVALVLATQEIAVDGYFVENLEPDERASGSAVRGYMEAFAELGALAGLGWLYHHLGWSVAVITPAVLMVLFTVPALVRRETPVARPELREARAGASIGRFLKRPDSRLILPLLVAGGLGLGMYFAMLGAFLVDRGFGIDRVGLVLGICVVLAWLGGGPIVVTLVRRLQLRRTLGVFAFLFVPAFASALWLASAPPQGLWTTIAALTLPSLMLAQFTILFYVARLGWCSRGQAATDFAVQSAAFRLGATAAVGLGGAIAAAAGWQGFFAFYAGYVTLVTLLFYWLEPRIAAQVARRESAAAQPGSDGTAPEADPQTDAARA